MICNKQTSQAQEGVMDNKKFILEAEKAMQKYFQSSKIICVREEVNSPPWMERNQNNGCGTKGTPWSLCMGEQEGLEETVKYLLDKMKLETAVMSKDTIYLGVLQKGC